jgi:hypothetical protein
MRGLRSDAGIHGENGAGLRIVVRVRFFGQSCGYALHPSGQIVEQCIALAHVLAREVGGFAGIADDIVEFDGAVRGELFASAMACFGVPTPKSVLISRLKL